MFTSQVLRLWYLLHLVAVYLSLPETGVKHSGGMKVQFLGFLHVDKVCFTAP